MITISHEERFGEIGLFLLFNVETDGKGGTIMSPVRKPLWGLKKRKLSRGEKAALSTEDKAIAKIGKPGSKERLASYAAIVEKGELMFTHSYRDEKDNEDED